ncbi:DMT family transporter [Roseovarius sp. SCSIO 43702]|uniref:DMT family transporter n=1 Tax=Roseovarius sp. SCSIO 43702 TaxID=2823043 RepID=UPI001C72AD7C|nr:DMT family transporter [Roseovarius sp. SCSIO 43702]QYX57560.1 DMT family transporter [Roseovarius sp. SCSIO 43702]
MITDNLKGALCIIAAMVCFVVNDVFVKLMGESVAWHQVIVMRSVAAAICLVAVSPWLGGWPGPRRMGRLMRDRRVMLRVGFETLGMTVWVVALVKMPLSGAIAVNQLLPVFLMLGGVIVHGERPGLHRLGAAGVSILGVLMVVKPGSDAFSVYALLAALSAASMAARDTVTRSMTLSFGAAQVALLSIAAMIALGLVASRGTTWEPFSPALLGAAAGSGAALAGAFVLILRGVQMGDMSFLAPFRYTGLVVGLALAWAVFGERPDGWAILGAVIIVVAGVYLMARERRARARHGVPPADVPPLR